MTRRGVGAAARVRAAWGRATVVVALVVVAAGVAAAPAAADEQPSILRAYGLDWIERVRDDAWPQPKAQRPVICLLDTGVAVTPDTPADDPNGPIVARLAIDGGSGLPQGSTFEHLHGTTMASVIAAPRNGWGTVGVFPQARIVSVRVTVDEATYITPADMELGARSCRRWAIAASVRVGAVVMAESGYDQRPDDGSRWTTAANDVAPLGGNFVAAAGNDQAAQALPPASAANVLVVSAGDDTGQRCGFASAEPASGLRGPGCSNGSGWPAGSSAATAAVGALFGALAALSPGSSAAELLVAVQSLRSGTGALDASRTGSQVLLTASPQPTAGLIAAATAPSVSPPAPLSVAPVVGPAATARTVLWIPDVKARWTSGRLNVRRADHRGGRVFVTTDVQPELVLTVRGKFSSIRLKQRPKRLTVWAASKAPGSWRSLTGHVKVAG